MKISLIDKLVEESTSSEYHRVLAEIARDPPDAMMVSSVSEVFPYRQLIVDLAAKNRPPAIYAWRDYVGLWRRLANDVHQILSRAKAGDISIYPPTKFEFVVNLKTAKSLGLAISPTLLGRADEVIEWKATPACC